MSVILGLAIETGKRLCAMDRRSSTPPSQAFPSGRRLAVGVWVAAVLAVFMTLAPGAAEACSKQHASGGITSSVDMANKTTHVAQASAVSVSNMGVAAPGPYCCGVGGHCSTAGCV